MANAFNFNREQRDVKAGIMRETDIGGVPVLHVAQFVIDYPAREGYILVIMAIGKANIESDASGLPDNVQKAC